MNIGRAFQITGLIGLVLAPIGQRVYCPSEIRAARGTVTSVERIVTPAYHNFPLVDTLYTLDNGVQFRRAGEPSKQPYKQGDPVKTRVDRCGWER